MQKSVSRNQLIQNNNKNFALHSGERQTATSLQGIRVDHTLRYKLAVEFIQNKEEIIDQCLDIFCGNGYGTFLMAREFPQKSFYGIDGSNEAIIAASENYRLKNNNFANKIFPFDLEINTFDLITCFESIEHVEDDSLLLNKISNSLKNNGYLIISVPNENIHSLAKNPHPFHFRHYKHEQMLKLLEVSFDVLNWYGQNTYNFDHKGQNTFQLLIDCDMELNEKTEGQVNMYIARKKI